jgi:Mpv17 / PMP22 family
MAPMISMQFTALTLLEGKTLKDAAVRVKRDLPATATAGACYWPFIGLAQSRFVPVYNRPAVGSFAGLFWNIYLSHQANIALEPVDVDVQFVIKQNADGSLQDVKETTTVIAPTGTVVRPTEASTVQIIDSVTAADSTAADSKTDSTSTTDTNTTATTGDTTDKTTAATDEALRRQQTITKVVVVNHHETQLRKPALVRRRTTIVSM